MIWEYAEDLYVQDRLQTVTKSIIYAKNVSITSAATAHMIQKEHAERKSKMNEQQEKISEWLNRAFHTESKIKALELVREKNKALALRCSSSGGNGGSSGGHENSQEKILIEICENDKEIRAEIQLLIEQRKEISAVIHSLENAEYEAILDMRYLAYKKTHEIANEFHYDRKTIQRKHKAALDRIIEKKMSLNVALTL